MWSKVSIFRRKYTRREPAGGDGTSEEERVGYLDEE